jgi:hypothetical protein
MEQRVKGKHTENDDIKLRENLSHVGIVFVLKIFVNALTFILDKI